jgi:hypothetical protein
MSTEDQDAAIGRLATERASVKRQVYLLANEIQDTADKIIVASRYLRVPGGPENAVGLGLLDEVRSIGGLDRLRSIITEHMELRARLLILDERARDIGL